MSTNNVNTENWFFSAPYQYLQDHQLDIYDKAVYTVLCAHASAASKTAFPSAKTIATEGGLSRAKVFVCLKKLESLGYIKRKQRFKVTVDKDKKERRISNDTNEYTLVLPSTQDGLPPSPHDRLVHSIDYVPSPPHRLVHGVDHTPSPQHGHITDIDFDYDLDNDDDKKIVHNLSMQIYEELSSIYADLTLLTVCQTLDRCLDHNPGDLYKYAKKAVIKEMEDMLKGKTPKVNASKLKRREKKPVRQEYLPDWFDEAQENILKPKPKTELTEEELAAKKREIEEMLKQV